MLSSSRMEPDFFLLKLHSIGGLVVEFQLVNLASGVQDLPAALQTCVVE